MKVYSFSPQELTPVLNQAIDLVAKRALEKGLIDNEAAKRFYRLRVVATDDKNFFSRMISKLLGQDDLHIRVVEVLDGEE